MSVELAIINRFCQDRETQTLHKGHVSGSDNLDKDFKLVFNLIEHYYNDYEEKNSISEEELITYFNLKYPDKKKDDDIRELMSAAYGMKINVKMVDQLLDQFHEKYVATGVINKLLPVMEGEKYGVLPSVGDTVTEYLDSMHYKPEARVVPTYCGLSLDELITKEIDNVGIPWGDNRITRIIGGVRAPSLGLIYAYTDSGKTSFAFDSVASFLRHIPQEAEIVYAGNEEDAGRLKLRLAQAILKWPRNRIKEEKRKAAQMLESVGWDRVKVYDEITRGNQVEYLLKTHNPAVMVIDQATDVEVKTERRTEGVDYLKFLFKYYRKLTNKHKCGIIGVSQGGHKAENKKWLTLTDIYGSKVAIQGSLDYSIGIGRKLDRQLANMRYFNFAKNKFNLGEGRLTSKFQKECCLWEPA